MRMMKKFYVLLLCSLYYSLILMVVDACDPCKITANFTLYIKKIIYKKINFKSINVGLEPEPELESKPKYGGNVKPEKTHCTVLFQPVPIVLVHPQSQ